MVIALLIFALFTVINMTVFRLAEQEIAQLERTIILKEAEVRIQYHLVQKHPHCPSVILPVRRLYSLFGCYASCSSVMLPVRLLCFLFVCYASCSSVMLPVRLLCFLLMLCSLFDEKIKITAPYCSSVMLSVHLFAAG